MFLYLFNLTQDLVRMLTILINSITKLNTTYLFLLLKLWLQEHLELHACLAFIGQWDCIWCILLSKWKFYSLGLLSSNFDSYKTLECFRGSCTLGLLKQNNDDLVPHVEILS